MKKILLLGNHIETTIVRLFSLLRELFEERGYAIMYYKDISSDNVPDNLDELIMYPPRMDFIANWAKLLNTKTKIFLIVEDMHFHHDICPTLDLQPYITSNIVRYPHTFVKHFTNLQIESAPIIHFPNSVPREGFRVPDFSKKLDRVLVCGAVNKDWYPLRKRGEKLVTSHVKQHPGYITHNKDSKKIFETFMDTINEYWLCIAGSCPETKDLPYIIAKHFEIPAAGTAMITDSYLEPYLRELGFEPFVHYIPATEETLEEVVDRWLKPENENKLINIIEASQALVRNFYVTEDQVANMFD